jgi:CBS domain-containing protein
MSKPFALVMKINEIMKRNVVTIESTKTVADVARQMTERGVGCLVVTKEGKIAGIVTERDIVIRLITQNLDPGKVKVEEIMTKNVVTYPPDSSVSEVIQAMSRHRIRRVPIVDGRGKLVGIVTSYDIALLGCPWMPAH